MFRRTVALLIMLVWASSQAGAATASTCEHAPAATHHGAQHSQHQMPAHESCQAGCPAHAGCTTVVSVIARPVSVLVYTTSTITFRSDHAVPAVSSITAIFHPPRV